MELHQFEQTICLLKAFVYKLHLLTMKSIRLNLILLCIIIVGVLPACKKEDLKSDLAPVSNPSAPISDKLKDSSLAYARDIYLWYNQIPSDFNAKGYEDLDKLMTGIRQY